MSELRRQQVVELAARYNIPIVEDDPYGQLRYEGDHRTPLFVLDGEHARQHAPDGHERQSPSDDPVRGTHVLYTSTFSKLLAPGLRTGWILAPEEVIESLVILKQGSDLHTSTFDQRLTHETCRGGFLDRHIRVIRSVYSERRQTMLDALARHMPSGVTWTRPAGGLFLWVRLPAGLDAKDVLRVAVEKHVAFVPGEAFHTTGGGQNTLRLNFSHCVPERIEVGIGRLAEAVRECLSRMPSEIG
jgi:2-aminoadipate transaminase